MACSSCGAKKGHLGGCPEGSRDKRGGPPPKGGKRTDPVGRRTPPMCKATSSTANNKEHPGAFHVCIDDKGHGGGHSCGCGAGF